MNKGRCGAIEALTGFAVFSVERSTPLCKKYLSRLECHQLSRHRNNHADNAYYLPATTILSKRMKTHTRVSWLRRPARHDGDRAPNRRHRVVVGARSARCPQAELLWRRGAGHDALQHARHRQRHAATDRESRKDLRLSETAYGRCGIQRQEPVSQARHRAHAGRPEGRRPVGVSSRHDRRRLYVGLCALPVFRRRVAR
jgi:hypothetical protein